MCMDRTAMIFLLGAVTYSRTFDIVEFLIVTRHEAHHDHSDNIDVADLVLDAEHILDDLDIYTERDLEKMDVDEKVGEVSNLEIILNPGVYMV